jgi:hypothetical protein
MADQPPVAGKGDSETGERPLPPALAAALRRLRDAATEHDSQLPRQDRPLPGERPRR